MSDDGNVEIKAEEQKSEETEEVDEEKQPLKENAGNDDEENNSKIVGGDDGDEFNKNRANDQSIEIIEEPKASDDDGSDGTIAVIACCSCFCIGILLLIILLPLSLRRLESTEYGLEYTKYKKTLDDAAKTGGLHSGPPGFKFIKFPSTFITVDLPDDICVSGDGLRVGYSVTFQYLIPQTWVRPCVIKYRTFENWAPLVEAAGNSAVQHTCSEFNISNFQNKRGEIQATMEQNVRLKLEGPDGDGAGGIFARVVSLQLQEVTLPEAYQQAVRDKQAAAEDITLAQNQRTQETTKARTQLLSAREQARQILNTAENDANVTLTEARLKAEETLFAFETEAEVIVRVKDNLNLSTDGVLGYLANNLYAQVSTLKVKAGEPARISRKDEL